ncbi:hypothetical protein [Metabacillus fastidiosus]|uniref:hypothetical protein n=1 Tax=Metabacillus fastidiosus TaxID=1458 RepID=UPI003D29A2E7
MDQKIVHHRERCVFCKKKKATLLCDFVKGSVWNSINFQTVPDTCDRSMCNDCATELSSDFHFCPKCVEITKIKLGNKR